MNTFQATLRARIGRVGASGFVVQRLKREESIVRKLRRHRDMNLVHMQDIAGLRAVLPDTESVNALAQLYQTGSLSHELLKIDDYISHPKASGYRSIHLVYKYQQSKVTEFNGYRIEIQLRTQLQHIWATAVETFGVYYEAALKASEGPGDVLEFFSMLSAGFSIIEGSPVHEDYKVFSDVSIFESICEQDISANVRETIFQLKEATNLIDSKKSGSLHLIVLNLRRQEITVRTYSQAQSSIAVEKYSELERTYSTYSDVNVVLVTSKSVKDLKKAYPNYFLDLSGLEEIIASFYELLDDMNRLGIQSYGALPVHMRPSVIW